MTSNLHTPLLCAVGLALVVLTAGSTAAQTAPSVPTTPKAGMGANMMADRQKMMAEMKASEKKLDDLVAAMNQAKGSEKVDRVAALVTEMVAQHREMHTRMMSGGMMMQMPQPAPAATIPVPAAPGTGADDHAVHHPKP
ncbi:MAG TPA: hypothetical protein VI485_19775 [Vicinamibacterales bacterium]|nr:hypothetical protein [Vicinamibacterales bacterium]